MTDREALFNTLSYFWTEKSDVTRYSGYDEEEFKREFPLWHKAIQDLELQRRL